MEHVMAGSSLFPVAIEAETSWHIFMHGPDISGGLARTTLTARSCYGTHVLGRLDWPGHHGSSEMEDTTMRLMAESDRRLLPPPWMAETRLRSFQGSQ